MSVSLCVCMFIYACVHSLIGILIVGLDILLYL